MNQGYIVGPESFAVEMTAAIRKSVNKRPKETDEQIDAIISAVELLTESSKKSFISAILNPNDVERRNRYVARMLKTSSALIDVLKEYVDPSILEKAQQIAGSSRQQDDSKLPSIDIGGANQPKQHAEALNLHRSGGDETLGDKTNAVHIHQAATGTLEVADSNNPRKLNHPRNDLGR